MKFDDLEMSTFTRENFEYVNSKANTYYFYRNHMDIELMFTKNGEEAKYHFRYNDKKNDMIYSTNKINFTNMNDWVIEYYKIRHLMDFVREKGYSNFSGNALDYLEEIT